MTSSEYELGTVDKIRVAVKIAPLIPIIGTAAVALSMRAVMTGDATWKQYLVSVPGFVFISVASYYLSLWF